MWKLHCRGSVTTAVGVPDEPSERTVQRLRLTLHSTDPSAGQDDSTVEAPNTHINGVREKSPQAGPKVFGVVQTAGADSQQEVKACEWSVRHLREEMNYIREVRDSLEKVRARMYGRFGGMQQSMQKLSQDIRVADSQRQSLEAEVKVRTAAMEGFDQMNSSLITANIDLQKSLLENCLHRTEAQDQMRSLRGSFDKAEQRLREKDRQLAAAYAENHTLRLQVESSQAANSQALQETAQRLQSEFEARLLEEKHKHKKEIEALQAQIVEYEKQLEEAEEKVRLAEAKIAERDQRISEVERLLDCMAQERGQLQRQLEDREQSLSRLEQTNHVDEAVLKRYQQLEGETAELRERIKHLNDMVFCQQRKVKGMIEEVETLRVTVAQKDMLITELLDKIAITDCENGTRAVVETSDIGVSCDLPLRSETQPEEEVFTRRVRWTPRTASRLDSSLLRYTPQQYSSLLSNPLEAHTSTTSSTESKPDPVNPIQSTQEQPSTTDSTSAPVNPYA